jgi:hypothetical protein
MDENHNKLGKIETEPRHMNHWVETGEDAHDNAHRQDKYGDLI